MSSIPEIDIKIEKQKMFSGQGSKNRDFSDQAKMKTINETIAQQFNKFKGFNANFEGIGLSKQLTSSQDEANCRNNKEEHCDKIFQHQNCQKSIQAFPQIQNDQNSSSLKPLQNRCTLSSSNYVEQWTDSQLDLLQNLYKIHGSKWLTIATHLAKKPNTVKNRFNNSLKKAANIIYALQISHFGSKRANRQFIYSTLIAVLEFCNQALHFLAELSLPINWACQLFTMREWIIRLCFRAQQLSTQQIISIIKLSKNVNNKIRCFGVFKVKSMKRWRMSHSGLASLRKIYDVVVGDQCKNKNFGHGDGQPDEKQDEDIGIYQESQEDQLNKKLDNFSKQKLEISKNRMQKDNQLRQNSKLKQFQNTQLKPFKDYKISQKNSSINKKIKKEFKNKNKKQIKPKKATKKKKITIKANHKDEDEQYKVYKISKIKNKQIKFKQQLQNHESKYTLNLQVHNNKNQQIKQQEIQPQKPVKNQQQFQPIEQQIPTANITRSLQKQKHSLQLFYPSACPYPYPYPYPYRYNQAQVPSLHSEQIVKQQQYHLYYNNQQQYQHPRQYLPYLYLHAGQYPNYYLCPKQKYYRSQYGQANFIKEMQENVEQAQKGCIKQEEDCYHDCHIQEKCLLNQNQQPNKEKNQTPVGVQQTKVDQSKKPSSPSFKNSDNPKFCSLACPCSCQRSCTGSKLKQIPNAPTSASTCTFTSTSIYTSSSDSIKIHFDHNKNEIVIGTI